MSPVRIRVPPRLKVLQITQNLKTPIPVLEPFYCNRGDSRSGEDGSARVTRSINPFSKGRQGERSGLRGRDPPGLGSYPESISRSSSLLHRGQIRTCDEIDEPKARTHRYVHEYRHHMMYDSCTSKGGRYCANHH